MAYGFYQSVRIDLIIGAIYINLKLRSLVFKIIKYNLLLHILPYFIICLIQSYVDLSFTKYFLNLVSNLFHLIHFMDLIMAMSNHRTFNRGPKYNTRNRIDPMDLLSVGITMSVYSMIIYLTTEIIAYAFSTFSIAAIIINTVILSIYHSFYCFNNLWQNLSISPNTRIDMHEKLWPLYMMYGLLPTIIYFKTSSPLFYGLYNILMMFQMMIPFLIKPVFPKKNSYPKINMTVFSYLTSVCVSISIRIIRHTFK